MSGIRLYKGCLLLAKAIVITFISRPSYTEHTRSALSSVSLAANKPWPRCLPAATVPSRPVPLRFARFASCDLVSFRPSVRASTVVIGASLLPRHGADRRGLLLQHDGATRYALVNYANDDVNDGQTGGESSVRYRTVSSASRLRPCLLRSTHRG